MKRTVEPRRLATTQSRHDGTGVVLVPGFLVVLAMTTVTCASPAARSNCVIDDSYVVVVEGSEPRDNTASRAEMDQLRAWLVSMPEHGAFLEAEARACAGDFIRVEVVRPLGIKYEAATVCKSEKGAYLVGVRDGERVGREATEAEWQKVREPLDGVSGRTRLGRPMPDGTAYFISYRVGGNCGQVGLYSPFLGTYVPEEEREQEALVENEKALVRHLLRVLRGR